MPSGTPVARSALGTPGFVLNSEVIERGGGVHLLLAFVI